MKKYTTESFIEKSKKVHGEKYDYSKVEYVNSNTKVCIICPEHGEFYITPGNFLYGQGCRLCGIDERKNKRSCSYNDFIKKAIEVHGNKYDYSKVEYINCDTKICIVCPTHGEFYQTPYHHINEKNGCPKCANNVKYTNEEFIEKAKKIHGNKYDYSKLEYEGSLKKVCIICPEHGEFLQTATNHLHGSGCPKCVGRNKTTEEFVQELKNIHGYNYDYSLVRYNGVNNPVRLICKKHGEFITTPHNLICGSGCKACGCEKTHEKQRLTNEEFIKNSKLKHGNKYDYSKVEYINATTDVCIICPKHGEFYITPNAHTSSKNGGCPKCAESSLERDIRVICENNNIEYISQKRFPWLKMLKLDFYFPEYKTALECQGVYHFEPKTREKNKSPYDSLLEQIHRDELKYKLLQNEKIRLLYYIPENLIGKTCISKIYDNNTNIFTTPKDLLKLLYH